LHVAAAERVAGTKVSLTPPAGFTKATQFPGFIKEEISTSIMVTEIPGPFSELARGFTTASMASKGMKLLTKSEVKIASGTAVLCHLSQQAYGQEFMKWMLAWGSEQEGVLVVATCPKTVQAEWSEPLKQALLSCTWDQASKINFFEGLTFRISEQDDLKIANKIGNSLILSRQGAFPQKNPRDPVVVVGASITQGWNFQGNREEFAKERLLSSKNFRYTKFLKTEKITINELEGQIIEAEAQDIKSGNQRFILHAIIFSPDGYYIFQGLADIKEKGRYALIFRRILESFKRV